MLCFRSRGTFSRTNELCSCAEVYTHSSRSIISTISFACYSTRQWANSFVLGNHCLYLHYCWQHYCTDRVCIFSHLGHLWYVYDWSTNTSQNSTGHSTTISRTNNHSNFHFNGIDIFVFNAHHQCTIGQIFGRFRIHCTWYVLVHTICVLQETTTTYE